jgi:hypothetical protein
MRPTSGWGEESERPSQETKSVDRWMRLECGVGFRQPADAVAHVRGSYVPIVLQKSKIAR